MDVGIILASIGEIEVIIESTLGFGKMSVSAR